MTKKRVLIFEESQAKPAVVYSPDDTAKSAEQTDVEGPPKSPGAIHIEFPGRAVFSIKCGTDPILNRGQGAYPP